MRQQPPDCLSAPGQTASRSQVRYLQALMHRSTILTESMPSSSNATFSHGICTPLASYAYTTCATCLPTLYCTVIQYTDACLSFFPASPPSEPSVAICRGKSVQTHALSFRIIPYQALIVLCILLFTCYPTLNQTLCCAVFAIVLVASFTERLHE